MALIAYVVIGIALYIWAFLLDDQHPRYKVNLKDLAIVVIAWPVLLFVALTRAAKKRDHWWEHRD